MSIGGRGKRHRTGAGSGKAATTPAQQPQGNAGEGTVSGSAEPAPRARSRRGSKLQQEMQAHLGQQLRAAHQAVVDEPIPERFRQLLDELAKRGS
ncbi:MAG: hypothetical protein JSR21_21315 [Proteobacteria bacterium]|nr:hypothetical protein [Pseudomonadota bacterium]